MNDPLNRRKFIQKVAAAIPIFSLLHVQMASAANPPLEESDPFAKSLKYCADAAKAEKSKASPCPARKEKDRANQFCRSCQLYTKESGEGAQELGKCMIIQGKSVAGGGWCQSWLKKPA